MPFPFLFLAISLILGILISAALSPSLPAGVLSCAAGLVLSWIFFLLRKNKATFLFILITTAFLGSSIYTQHNKNFETNGLHKLKLTDYADFYGTLYKSPSRGKDRDFLYLKLEKLRYQNKEENIRGNLRVTVLYSPETKEQPRLFSRDRVKISALLQSAKGFRNFREPPQQRSLKNQIIHNVAFSKTPLLVEKLESGKKWSFFRLISILRQKLQQKIEDYFHSEETKSISPEGAVLEALLIGERGRMDDAILLSLQKTGLLHLLAISGAHIGIISFLLFSLFRLVKIPQRLSYLILMIILIFYAFLVEGNASVLRAVIMTLAFLIGKLLWKDVHLINTISMSAFFLLLVNPFSLFDLGFELTYAATFSIILFYSRVIKYLPKLPLRMSELTAMSITAQLGVLPFMAYSFNRIAFSSLILNYIAIPLVGVIMAAGYIFFPFSFISPFLTKILALGINFSLKIFFSSMHLLDPLRFLSYRIPTPHIFTVIGYFLFFLLLLLPLKLKRYRRPIYILFGLFFAILILYPFPPSSSKNLKVTFIDVGQGDSILVEFPGHKKMLIDGGGFPEETFDVGERVVSPFLWRKGIKKIDYLVLTHAHPDHLSGLKAIAQNFKIKDFWESAVPLNDEKYKKFKSLLSRLTRQKRLTRGFSWQEGAARIEGLHPQNLISEEGNIDNDHSLVLRLSYGQTSFLFPGDIGSKAERQILDNSQDIESQVLKSAHHGSNSSSSMAFLEKVAPRIVVISVGEGNMYGFPNRDVLERCQKVESKIFRTDLHGAIEVSSNGQRIFIRTASGEYFSE
jgi:competence protein ComEC